MFIKNKLSLINVGQLKEVTDILLAEANTEGLKKLTIRFRRDEVIEFTSYPEQVEAIFSAFAALIENSEWDSTSIFNFDKYK